jgi:hypothetical protein
MTNPTYSTEGQTSFPSYCVECHAFKRFTTARARELWEQFHPHDDEEGDK